MGRSTSTGADYASENVFVSSRDGRDGWWNPNGEPTGACCVACGMTWGPLKWSLRGRVETRTFAEFVDQHEKCKPGDKRRDDEPPPRKGAIW